MRIFVTGATGFIGGRFCALALEAGCEVAGLMRPGSAGMALPGVQRVYGSLPYDVPTGAMRGCDVVVHLAAITTAARSGEAVSVNEIGTQVMVELAKEFGAGVVFVSTQSAHGGNNSAYARTKKRGEEIVRGASVPWAIVRPGLVYGPGEAGLYARMRRSVAGLPVLPMLGGGKALVQPIHVDDLAAGLVRLATGLNEFSGQELNLGDPDGLSLRDLMIKMARAQGKKGWAVNVPLWPVKAVVSVGERLRVPMPISMDNLRGMETVSRMETGSSLGALGMSLRDLDKGIEDSEGVRGIAAGDERLPVVLVGAGKIGIIHGMQVCNNPAARLAGIVEPNSKTADFYKSLGFEAPVLPHVDSLDGAKAAAGAAVICTPAFTHLEVADKCLARGMDILVEKPLTVKREDAAEWKRLRERYSDRVIHTGYMAAQFPHLLTAFHVARSGKLGRVVRARAVALQTHITSPEPVRWEMLKAKAGGGAMINFGCHVASILFRLLGWPESDVEGWQWPVYSTEVEDALIAKFGIKETKCELVVSWSVDGYARPMNLVELECEGGRIRVENSATTISRGDEVVVYETQLDNPLDFNISPDYTGAAFTAEHDEFYRAIASRDGRATNKPKFMPPVELQEALRLENWIFDLYDRLQKGKPTERELKEMGASREWGQEILSAGAP